jgi:hypothetical protein
MADQLVTPSELASEMQQDLDTASAVLVIEMATGKVQGAAGQRLVDATDTAVIDVEIGDCDPYLSLPQLPVRSVASVLIDGVADTTWLLRGQRLWRRYGWSVNRSQPTQVKVLNTHGYLAGSQFLQPARAMVFALAQVGYGNPSGATSESLDDYKVTYAEADARMQITGSMRDQLQALYGTGAYVLGSRG